MKKLLFFLIPCLLFLYAPVCAQDAQKVYLNKGLIGGGWDDYSLEMGHKSADNICSYTFHTDGNPSEKAYFRIKLVRTDDQSEIIVAPSGTEAAEMIFGQSVEVLGDGSGNKENSFCFGLAGNTTYTIRIEWSNYYKGKYNDMKLTCYKGGDGPSGSDGLSVPLLVSDNAVKGNFTKAAFNYYYYDLDLTDSADDFAFKFYSPKDKDYIGCEYKGFKIVNQFGFSHFYWASNELGPSETESPDGWRNEYFTLKHSVSGIKKYRINLWKDEINSIGGAQKWKFYIQDIDNFSSEDKAYYFVSRELTGGARLSEFKMSPSKQRDGERGVINTLWSFSLQDFMLKNMLGDEKYNSLDQIHYHIEDSNGNTYTSHKAGDNIVYDLGFRFDEDYYPTTDNKTEDIGRLLRYERYDNLQEGTKQMDGFLENTFVLPLKEKREKAKDAVSYIWLFDSNTKKLSIHVNAPNFGLKDSGFENYHEDSEGYSLVGNLKETEEGGNDYNVEVQKQDYSRKMRKFWFKNNKKYTSYISDADSIVYSVTVSRPKSGWKKGGYVFVVFPYSAILEARQDGFSDWGGVWAKAIRPQEQWKSPTDGENEYTGVDATALHGGLYVRSDEQTDNVQQGIAVTPLATTEAFTFSMNLTTSTYRFTLHSDLFIMGPAVGLEDGRRKENGWSTDNPDIQTAHAYKMTYDDTEECYMYKGPDGTGDEQPVPMAANMDFAFAYNKNFSTAFFEENYQKPVALIDGGGNSIEATAYDYDRNVNAEDYAQQYDTQYVNFLRRGNNGTSSYNPEQITPCRFGLPGKTDEGDGYYIRLYIGQSYNSPETQQYFYTIRRDNSFSIPVDPKNPIEGYDTFKPYCDYHAVVIPEGIDAFYIKETDKTNRVATLMEYPLGIGQNGKRVLPAFAAVILATNTGDIYGLDGTSTIKKRNVQLDYYYKPNYTEDNYEADFAKDFSDNKLKGQIERTMLPEFDGEHANFLLSYQQHYTTDEKNTLGFFKAGRAYNPVNSAYLQVEKDFLGSGTLAAKGWRIILSGSETTAISNVADNDRTAVDNACYTLQGVKVERPQAKGVYICGDRKVIVK